MGDTLQGMLEAEMDQKLGYSKYDYHRVPNLWLGREVLEKKLGHEFLENMDSYGTKLLKEHQIHP